MAPILPRKLIHHEPLREWNAAAAKYKLQELYTQVLTITDYTIQWYNKSQIRKGFFARGLKKVALVLFIAASLVPFIVAMDPKKFNYLLYLGYTMVGVAGGLLLFDRYYGISNSWIRFALTGMELQKQRNTFVNTWQVLTFNNSPLTKAGFDTMITALLKYQEVFLNTTKAETEQWAKEYQENAKDLVAAIQKQQDQFKSDIEAENTRKQQESQTDSQKKARQQTTTEEQNISENIPIRVINEAIASHFRDWQQAFNVNAIAASKKITGDEVTDINALVFSPVQKLQEGAAYFRMIPDSIRFKSIDGQTYDIPTDIISDGSEIFASAKLQCDNNLEKKPGCSISRDEVTDSSGTIGLKVYKDDQHYILGCFHVLCAPEFEAGQTIFSSELAIGSTTVISPSNEDQKVITATTVTIGRVVSGYFDEQLDTAMALIEGETIVNDLLCAVNQSPRGVLNITQEHADKRYAVKAVGRTSGLVSGVIQDAAVNCDINYNIQHKWIKKHLVGLIRSTIQTSGGDSGAPVFDNDNNIVGIVIANSASYTYILPIQRILSKLSITLKP